METVGTKRREKESGASHPLEGSRRGFSGFSQLRTERPKQKNHPLCGCASEVIPKNSPRWYNKVVQVLEYNERRILWQIAQTV